MFQSVGSQWFELMLLACIIASSVCLTLDTVNLDRDSQRGKALFVLDIIFTSVFLLEVGVSLGVNQGGSAWVDLIANRRRCASCWISSCR